MKKIRIFALILVVITVFTSVVSADGNHGVYSKDWKERYYKDNLVRGSGSTNSPELKPNVANLQGDIDDTGRAYCGVPDGIFGSQTLKGVKKYQRSKGLTVDGIAGPGTKSALWYEIGYWAPPVNY